MNGKLQLLAAQLLAFLCSAIIFTGSPTLLAQETNADSVDIEDREDSVVFSGRTMGPIQYRVVVARSSRNPTLDDAAKSKIAAAIESELSMVNSLMSTYVPSSDVSKFNRFEQVNQWFPVDLKTATVVNLAQTHAANSEGAFDITVGPLVNLWSFGSDQRTRTIPDKEDIAAALAKVGYQNLEVRIEPPALLKKIPAMEIDLSAIAKGWAVDRVALALSESGSSDFLVDVGGEVRSGGMKAGDTAWMVGVIEPPPGKNSVYQKVEMGLDQSIATSGDYQNFFVVDGTMYSHTIDPKTGWPVEHGLASVSIITEACFNADAAATAVSVLGPAAGIEYCEQYGFEYLMIERLEDGEFKEYRSDGFAVTTAQSSSDSVPASKGLLSLFLGALVVTLLVVAGMAVGVIFGRERIKGSCGGIASMDQGSVSPECSLCSQPTDECADLKKEIKRRQAERAMQEQGSDS